MKNNPLIIVFYIEREYMFNTTMITDYIEDINNKLVNKNTIAFFLPTDGESRIECINPKQVEPAEMDRINTIVSDLVKNFDMGNKNEEEDIEEEYE
jgi:hypothetical protein